MEPNISALAKEPTIIVATLPIAIVQGVPQIQIPMDQLLLQPVLPPLLLSIRLHRMAVLLTSHQANKQVFAYRVVCGC
ncbi:hypothetical protein BKE30_11870 [Alkanindiges hydrocarboniclasticus]|uniref:Uncharacterized protein n=1 Tax=Alkanindiges hydrocarboniclasticus TaxID=1907941 RepID=A0A1S8CRW1_9GAMM|nr:hypothetical protein BKE30_11870 [Alkanindiges hydrocarboniclasticus]